MSDRNGSFSTRYHNRVRPGEVIATEFNTRAAAVSGKPAELCYDPIFFRRNRYVSPNSD